MDTPALIKSIHIQLLFFKHFLVLAEECTARAEEQPIIEKRHKCLVLWMSSKSFDVFCGHNNFFIVLRFVLKSTEKWLFICIWVSIPRFRTRTQSEGGLGIDIFPGNYKYLKGIWIDLLSQAEKNIFSMTIPSPKKTFLVASRVQNYRSIYLSRLFQRKSLHTYSW